MLAARATRVFSAEDVIALERENSHHSIFTGDSEYFESAKISEDEADHQEDDNSMDKIATCRKSTQNACNSSVTTVGKVITIVMMCTIVLSVIIIILDSLNYQYCDNPCPVQRTNKSYAEEFPVSRQRDYIQRKLDESLGIKVNTVDIEPSGTAFFIINYPDMIQTSTCRDPKDTYCTYIRDSGILSYSQLWGLEIFCTVMFTVEFFVRLIVAQTYFPKCNKDKQKIDHSGKDPEGPFFSQTFTYLDFIAILPFYIDVTSASALGMDGSITNKEPGFLVFFDIFKLFRIFRVFKFLRFYRRSVILIRTIRRSIPPLYLSVVVLFLVFTLMGSIMLFLEPCNGEPFTPDCEFPDIVQSGYYTWITILTVGYGDQIPQTLHARLLGMVLMVMGTVFLAMPLTILGTYYDTAFVLYEDAIKREQEKQQPNKDHDTALVTEIPKAERKTRLLRSGMMLFNAILQSEKFCETQNTMAEEDEEGDADIAAQYKAKLKATKLSHSLQDFHYKICQDLVELYPLLRRHMPPRPKSITQRLYLHHEKKCEGEQKYKDDATTKSNKRRRCCGPKGNSRVQPDGLVTDDAEQEIVKTESEWRMDASKPGASWRDKMWLWLEYPDSSRSAKVGYIVRTLILMFSFGLAMISTFPEFQLSYGPAAPSCQRSARDYCNIMRSLPDDWVWPGDHQILFDWSQRWDGLTKTDVMRANPYCFNMTCGMLNAAPVAKATPRKEYQAPVVSEQNKQSCRANNKDPNEMIYSGCSGGSNADCAWPVSANYSSFPIHCPTVKSSSTVTSESQEIVDGKLVITERTLDTTTMSGPEPFDTTTLGQQIQFDMLMPLFNNPVPVCNRKVCQDLEAEDIVYPWIKPLGRPYGFNEIFLFLHAILVVFFALEFAVKMLAMRSAKRFFKSFFNWAELFCVLLSVYELVFVTWKFSHGMSGSAESNSLALGYESFGAPTFFEFFPADNFRMWCLVVPLRFILQIRNISTVRVIKETFVTALKKLIIPIVALVLIVLVLSGVMFTVETAFTCTVAKVHNNKFDSGAFVYRYVPNYPHTHYKEGPHDATNPELCHVQSYLDAIWLGFVTMTSVGYGLYTPKTILGKATALGLGLFGAFYMAMPLTIVGATFYREFKTESEREHKEKLRIKFRKFISQIVSHNRFNPRREVYTRGMHVQVSTSSGKWKEAVVITVHSNKMGRYDVQYEDRTIEKYVSDKLIRHVRANLSRAKSTKKAGTSQSNLTVFRQHLELLPPEPSEFTTEHIAQMKGCHQELMRCLGNIYVEEIHRGGHRKLH